MLQLMQHSDSGSSDAFVTPALFLSLTLSLSLCPFADCRKLLSEEEVRREEDYAARRAQAVSSVKRVFSLCCQIIRALYDSVRDGHVFCSYR